jgi:hypothetical protein
VQILGNDVVGDLEETTSCEWDGETAEVDRTDVDDTWTVT